MILWVSVSLMMLLIVVMIRHQHQVFSQKKFKYTLYSLRDRVRYLKASGQIANVDPWVFSYFDETLSKSIGESYYLTAYSLLGLLVRHSDSDSLDQFQQQLETSVGDNEPIMALRQEYADALMEYIDGQHHITFRYIMKPIILGIVGVAKFKQMFSRTLIYPESSVSQKYQAMGFAS